MMPYYSTKTFGHELGLSCCFRQWRAESHCNQLHGYALSFRFEFGCSELDDKNWVQDFGGFDKLKKELLETFDHKTVIATDDPELALLMDLNHAGVADVVTMEQVGCEAFAKYAYDMAVELLEDERVFVVCCEVREHGANSASYYAEVEEDEQD